MQSKKSRLDTEETNDPQVQLDIAEMYLQGIAFEKDASKAAHWFQKAAEQGNPPAQHTLGLMYENGTGVQKDIEEAIAWYLEAAEQGYAKAQTCLGYVYSTGTEPHVQKNGKEALHWYQKAARQGNAAAQLNLGLMYERGNEVHEDHTEAIRWYQKAAQQGDSQAQAILGSKFEKGDGVSKDRKKAIRWYRSSAQQGNTKAQISLADIYGKGDSPNRSESLKWYRKAANHKSIYAQHRAALLTHSKVEKAWWYQKLYHEGQWRSGLTRLEQDLVRRSMVELATLYEKGEGVEQSSRRAIHLCGALTELYANPHWDDWGTYARASRLLGDIYRSKEAPHDIQRAVKWYKEAANYGGPSDNCNLGLMYRSGEEIDQDLEEAAKWIRKAAKGGHTQARYILGLMYRLGEGMRKDPEAAAKFVRMAAKSNPPFWNVIPEAQFTLGRMYERGEGVKTSQKEALKWYQNAAAKGDERAIAAVRRLEKNDIAVPRVQLESKLIDDLSRKKTAQSYDLTSYIICLVRYHPYRDGKNPHFDDTSGLLIDLKERKPKAIEAFTQMIEEKAHAVVDNHWPIAVVPPHDPDDPESGIQIVAQRLIERNEHPDATDCLYRAEFVPPQASNSGRRSRADHRESLDVQGSPRINQKTVLLLDDITTTGQSMEVAKRLLLQAGAAKVQCLAIGRTS